MKQINHSTRAASGTMTAVLVAIIGAAGVVLGSYMGRPPKPDQSENIPPAPPAVTENTQSSGSAFLPDGTLVCWGQAELTDGSGGDSRGFAFKFKDPFAASPTVTTGINAKSGGYAYAVYNFQLTEELYAGRVVEIEYRKTSIPVTMHYFAIGLPKTPRKK
jgi:hypothetical protein